MHFVLQEVGPTYNILHLNMQLLVYWIIKLHLFPLALLFMLHIQNNTDRNQLVYGTFGVDLYYPVLVADRNILSHPAATQQVLSISVNKRWTTSP